MNGKHIKPDSTLDDERFYAKNKTKLPKGIYYERSKHRWRVRLYKAGTVVHLSYYKSFPEALENYQKAKDIQRESKQKKLEQMTLSTYDTPSLINTLSKL